MAIHAMKVKDFHSKLTSCLACRLAGRMAIHAVKVEDFHSKLIQYITPSLTNQLCNSLSADIDSEIALMLVLLCML